MTLTIRKLMVFTIILAAAQLGVEAAPGQEIVTVSATDHVVSTENTEFSELQARLEAVEAQMQQSMAGGYDAAAVQGGHHTAGAHAACGCGHHGQPACDQCGCCADCCRCQPCCRRPGPYIDAEFAYLKPHNSSGTGFSTTAVAVALPLLGIAGRTTLLDFPIDPEFEATMRLSAGWQLADGFGVRGHFWEFDHSFTEGAVFPGGALIGGIPVGGAAVNVFHNWDTFYFDLEAFDATDFGGWAITWSGGVRYTSYNEERGLSPVAGVPVLLQLTKTMEDIGLTSSVEFRRKVTCNLGVFTNARASFLMGDEVNTLTVIVTTTAPGFGPIGLVNEQRNDIKFIYETQIGAEYTRPMGCGAFFFARAGAEMQYWDNLGTSTLAPFFDESTAFAGLFASVGLMR
jgi:hypothetical protein